MKSKKLLVIILLIAAFLRFWKLSDIPVSLFGDELDVGYHAYSILNTGKDYYGNTLPLHFHSLAEWRTPLYLYSVVPTVAIWGISALGVRVPAAIFGVLGVYAFYLLVNELFPNKKLKLGSLRFSLGEIAAFFLAISPWHIQYSRAAFEVTQLVLFMLLGLYFFFRSLKDGKYLWLSVLFFVLTPWVYSTAKLFTPLLMIFIFVVWKKDIISIKKAHLKKAVIAGLIVGLPIAVSTIFGGGAQRFSYVNIFSDPTIEPEVGVDRLHDARFRGEEGTGLSPTLPDRVLHNKFTFWGEKLSDNFFDTLSFSFLFNNGDPNLRHSIEGMGQLYRVEIVALLLGLIFFFSGRANKKLKWLIVFWILAGIIPSVITRNGGTHATRLILILPPLMLLISYGLVEGLGRLKGKLPILLTGGYVLLLGFNFINYQHNFWVHNPWYSERWWHYGWKQAINSIKEVEGSYDRVFLSMTGEPAWIFFAGTYEYPSSEWQTNFPVGNDTFVEGFGGISFIDKYYFGSPDEEGSAGIFDLRKFITNKDLYLANASEVPENLIMYPNKSPVGLKLIKSIPFPSGEPAFYLFSGE